jgi:hypothetical protein
LKGRDKKLPHQVAVRMSLDLKARLKACLEREREGRKGERFTLADLHRVLLEEGLQTRGF